MVQTGAERVGLGELVCQVAPPLRSYSLLEMAVHLKRFVKYQDAVDVVIAELDPESCDRIQSAIQRKGYPLQFSEVGHEAILFGYIGDRKSITYTTLERYKATLQKVKGEMISNAQTGLYQICTEENQEKVKEFLAGEQFRVL